MNIVNVWQRPIAYLTILSIGLILFFAFSQLGKAQTNPFGSLSADQQDCVKRTLGEPRYNELSAGAQFTEADGAAVGNAGCFQQKTAVGGSTVTPTKINPFENLSDQHKKCLQDALGADRFKALEGGAAWTEADQQTIQKTVCQVASYQGSAGEETKYKEGEFKKEEFQPDPEIESCIERVFGAERFAEMKKGTQPTPGEMEKAKTECFSSDKYKDKYVKQIETNKDFASFEKCFSLVVGPERLRQMKEGGQFSITEEERKKAYECMGKDPHPAAPRPEMKMSATLEKCLKTAVGEEGFTTISSGQREPTADEHSKGEACFRAEYEGKKTVLKPDTVLPPPPEQVPFVKEDKTVKVEDVKTATEKVEFGGSFEGAKEGQVVDVYVYSQEPKQVTATVGKNGTWTLSYDGDLSQGEHKVYAVARKAGDLIRSAVKTFTVGGVQAQTQEKAAETTKADGVSKLLGYYIAIVAGVAIAAVVIFLLARSRQAK